MRQAFDAFEAWRMKLPPGAQDTRVIEERGRSLQAVVRSPFSPLELFFRRFPQLAGSNDLDTVQRWVIAAKAELESVLSRYRQQGLVSLDDCLQLGPEAPIGSMRERFACWRDMLPDDVGDRLGGVARNLLNLNLDFYNTDQAFIDAAAALLVGRQPKRWDDADLQRFRNEVSSVTSRIEAAALSEVDNYGEAAAYLVERRLKTYTSRLIEAVGSEVAAQRLQEILHEIRTDKYGKPGRSAKHG
jgi:hypothetical protein